ncbi:MAG: hypothetical protein O9308_16120 [Beijerinckiaceae bacterium]|nr:hypothetical protein [Beijerinckiaceae bacterium]
MVLARLLGLSGLAASSLMILWIVLWPAGPHRVAPDPALAGWHLPVRP